MAEDNEPNPTNDKRAVAMMMDFDEERKTKMLKKKKRWTKD